MKSEDLQKANDLLKRIEGLELYWRTLVRDHNILVLEHKSTVLSCVRTEKQPISTQAIPKPENSEDIEYLKRCVKQRITSLKNQIKRI